MRQLEIVLDAKATLGEGPSWDTDAGILYWVDILEKQVHIYQPKTNRNHVLQFDQYVGCVAPRRSGGLIMGMHHGFFAFDPASQQYTQIIDPERDKPNNRFNDGKCDPAGRFWAGTMSLSGKPNEGALYRLNTDFSVDRVIENVSISNGLAWSLDGRTMYFIDTATQSVDAFDFDLKTGDISNRRTVLTIPEEEGSPDGMTIDEEGMLWIAHWDGWQVARWNPVTGEKMESILVPAARCTSCVFGGEDMNELYITTARIDLTEEQQKGQPYAGGLFRIKLDVKGAPTYSFNG